VIARARAGDRVEIHAIVLAAGTRAPQVPADTRAVPLEMRVKGEALHEAAIGDLLTVRTAAGRELRGRLESLDPAYGHGFGTPPRELTSIANELRSRLSATESGS
jgi:hypothetical protein